MMHRGTFALMGIVSLICYYATKDVIFMRIGLTLVWLPVLDSVYEDLVKSIAELRQLNKEIKELDAQIDADMENLKKEFKAVEEKYK